MIRDLHHRQIALGNAGDEIRPSRDPQIGAADPDQAFVRGKNVHQELRNQFAGGEKENGGQSCKQECQIEELPKRALISLSPVLCAQNRGGTGNREQEHVLHKLDLRRQGDSCHLLLRDPTQHQRISRGN